MISKKKLGLIGLLGTALAGVFPSTTATTATAATDGTTISAQQTAPRQDAPAPAAANKEKINDYRRANEHNYLPSKTICPPKQYGEALQQKGRQKYRWTKSKKNR